MEVLPTGTVTFLFTDVEGSTRVWQENPETMGAALARHDAIMREAVASSRGVVFSTAGDSFAAAFSTPSDAVEAATEAQVRLDAEVWTEPITIRVRMGIHTGMAELRDGNYFGPVLNQTARLMAAGNGGQVLASEVTARLLDRVDFEDLGVHRLKDLREPVAIFQLRSSRLAPVLAPLRVLAPAASNLPTRRRSFVGRSVETERLSEELVPGCLVTLTGAGGCGKTTLAVEAAACVLECFDGGVWLVELAQVRTPDAVAAHVAAVLDVPVMAGMSPVRAMAKWVGQRGVLLVVDNCEHVVDAAATLIEELREHCGNLGVLATSREGLAADGETLIGVAPLGVDASVELFIDRADLRPESLQPSRRQAIYELCAHLDGLPLAIELAAARTRTLSPEEIGRRLGERFELIGGAKRARSDRHRTLRTAVDWSYALLSADEQDLFTRLGVFVGRFDLDAVAAMVADTPLAKLEVIDVLDHLVDKSMVIADTSRPQPVYWLLETLRDYALDHLLDTEQTRCQHARYHARLVQRLVGELTTEREAAAIEDLDRSWPDVRAAVEWSVAQEEADIAVDLVRGLGFETFFRIRVDVRDWVEAVLAMPDVATHQHRGQLFATAALAALTRGDLASANERNAQSIAARPDGPISLDEQWAGAAVPVFSGRPEEALAAAQAFEASTDLPPVVARLLASGIAALCESYGDNPEADRLVQPILALADMSSISSVLRAAPLYLAAQIRMRDDPHGARQLLERALTTASVVRNPWLQAAIGMMSGHLDARLGDPTEALARYRSVLVEIVETNNYGLAGALLRRVACALGRTGRYQVALAVIAAVDHQPHAHSIMPEIAVQLAELDAAAGDALPTEAIRAARLQGQGWSIPQTVQMCIDEINQLQ